MKPLIIAVSAAAMLAAGGQAYAAGAKQTTMYPAKPIPYSQYDAYARASARDRADRDWWGGGASTTLTSTSTANAMPGTVQSPPTSNVRQQIESNSKEGAGIAASDATIGAQQNTVGMPR